MNEQEEYILDLLYSLEGPVPLRVLLYYVQTDTEQRVFDPRTLHGELQVALGLLELSGKIKFTWEGVVVENVR